MHIELVSHPLCPYVQRSVIQLREKNVPFEVRYVDLKNKPPWFLAISPRGKVPVLVVQPDGTTEKTALFESSVINEYLDETHPPRLLPEDPLKRARLRAFVEVANDLFGAMVGIFYGTTEEKYRESRDAAARVYERLESEIGGEFFAGDRFSLIDAAFAPAFHRFAMVERKAKLGLLDGPPSFTAWARRLASRPTVVASVAPDFEERHAAYLKEKKAWIATRFG